VKFKEGSLAAPFFFCLNINNMMVFKKTFLKEFNIAYNGEKEFDELSAIISQFNNYNKNTEDIENNVLYPEDEKQKTLKNRYAHALNAWKLHIHPRLEKMKQMDPNNLKFLPKISTIPVPK